ncbi:hypothetical protein CC78DRAFT_500227 [Lojkania enalia]|uniref:Zn(2)-C6 fungal-type domain-containing protein n=1 Tax=Lojkania enalia TaxID=147567 RepID=A0A9P4K5K9_9PLEO|nr:hypothetical protein CC78DRAFT_500227 [Didymosphaeria enalia]
MGPRKGTRRACDPCSVRKVRCDGNKPCSRCLAASWACTYLKTHGKSGPKGPRRTTEEAIRRIQECSKANEEKGRSNSETSLEDASHESPLEHFHESNDLELGWPDIAPGAAFPTPGKEPTRISISCISHYLDIYQARGYPIWPVVDSDALLARLITHQEDMQAYGLAAAICAATISQFQIDAQPKSPVDEPYCVSSARFEDEARKAMNAYDHMEKVTICSLLSSFFLHVYSADIGRMTSSTVLLGEAITKAHILGLYKVSHYEPMNLEKQQYHLRIYWLLFITERAHSIQHDVPTALKRAPDLPALGDLHDGSITPAFLQLCRLFSLLDTTVTVERSGARRALTLAQKQLNDDVASKNLENELQRADISMTQQWMRIFLWQKALEVTSMSSTDPDHEFSFSFPAKVAKDVLSYLTSLSRESLEAHGPGMETKLFDIANSLADVMICVPAINRDSHFSIGPRDLIHSLSTLLGSFRGGNPTVVNILQEKLTKLGVSTSSPQKLINLVSPEDECEQWRSTSCALAVNQATSFTTPEPVRSFPPNFDSAL